MDRSAKLRAFYARRIAGAAGIEDPAVAAAFAAVPREAFLGPAPWFIPVSRQGAPSGPVEYLATPDDDPAFAYGDWLIAIDRARAVHNGEPSLHARCLAALAVRPGETVLHIGAGLGYYTAILGELAGRHGRVLGFEIDLASAERAQAYLAPWPQVTVAARSGTAPGLPAADAIYVSAGAPGPARAWLDALQPGGRLLFPLQSSAGHGAMLFAEKPESGPWPARFVLRAGFIPCQDMPEAGARDTALQSAFQGPGWREVAWLHLGGEPDATCWFAGEGFWLGR